MRVGRPLLSGNPAALGAFTTYTQNPVDQIAKTYHDKDSNHEDAEQDRAYAADETDDKFVYICAVITAPVDRGVHTVSHKADYK